MTVPTTPPAAWLRQSCPACPLACPALLDTPDPLRQVLEVRCAAPSPLRAAYGYPGLCPHRGPFQDPEEAMEWQGCPVLRACPRR